MCRFLKNVIVFPNSVSVDVKRIILVYDRINFVAQFEVIVPKLAQVRFEVVSVCVCACVYVFQKQFKMAAKDMCVFVALTIN